MMPLPEPLTPADCDLRSFRYMSLDVVRLIDSDTYALSSGDEFKVAIALWCKAWHQVPAGSVPDDDRVLARLTGLTLDQWMTHRERALSSFVKCADGRFYHPVVCEKATEAWEAKQAQKARTDAARKARDAKRGTTPTENAPSSQRKRTSVTEGDNDLSQSKNASIGEDRRGEDIDSSLRSESTSSSLARDPFDRRRWFDALVAASGPGLVDPAKNPNLWLASGELDVWSNAGVDLVLDAVPTIAALTAKARGDPIASWGYFRAAVLKALQARTTNISADLEAAKKAVADDHAKPANHRPADAKRLRREALARTLAADGLASATTAPDRDIG